MVPSHAFLTVIENFEWIAAHPTFYLKIKQRKGRLRFRMAAFLICNAKN